jgi:hypothetical protein
MKVCNGERRVKGERALRDTHYRENHGKLPKEGVVDQLRETEITNNLGEKMFVPLAKVPDNSPLPAEGTAEMFEREQNCEQNSEFWYQRRKVLPPGAGNGRLVRPINASAIPSMILGSDADRKKWWMWHFGRSDQPPGPCGGEDLHEGLEWGHKHEVDARVTMMHHQTRHLGNDAKMYEVGLYRLKGDLAFVAVTPDGMVKVGGTKRAQEFKCPFWGERGQVQATDYKGFRPRYVIQTHVEMKGLDADVADLLSWDPDTSTVFEALFSEELWALLRQFLLEWINSTEPPKTSQLTETIKELVDKIAANVKPQVKTSVRAI